MKYVFIGVGMFLLFLCFMVGLSPKVAPDMNFLGAMVWVSVGMIFVGLLLYIGEKLGRWSD